MSANMYVNFVLSDKLGIDSEKYDSVYNEIFQNVNEVAPLLNQKEDDIEVVKAVADYYHLKNKFIKVESLKEYLDLAGEYKDQFSLFFPLFTVLNSVNFMGNPELKKSFFVSLCKKTKFCAADLGDENNENYLTAIVKIINYSFFEELEKKGVSTASKNVDFEQVVDINFKESFWKRIDGKVALLKLLKKEVFDDDKMTFIEDPRIHKKQDYLKDVETLSNV